MNEHLFVVGLFFLIIIHFFPGFSSLEKILRNFIWLGLGIFSSSKVLNFWRKPEIVKKVKVMLLLLVSVWLTFCQRFFCFVCNIPYNGLPLHSAPNPLIYKVFQIKLTSTWISVFFGLHLFNFIIDEIVLFAYDYDYDCLGHLRPNQLRRMRNRLFCKYSISNLENFLLFLSML